VLSPIPTGKWRYLLSNRRKQNSDDDDIVRYKQGIKMISRLTGKSIEELENLIEREEDKDSEIVDIRILVENILFEYSFPLTEDEEINEQDGWWHVFSLIDGEIGEIDRLEQLEREEIEMKKIEIKKIKNMSFGEGKKVLEAAGYFESDSGRTESNISDYVEDIYFSLFDEDDEEIDKVCYACYCNYVEGDEDDIVKEGWEEF